MMKPGDQASIAGLDVAFLGATPFTGPNYTAERGRFVVEQGGNEISTLAPEKRRIPAGPTGDERGRTASSSAATSIS